MPQYDPLPALFLCLGLNPDAQRPTLSIVDLEGDRLAHEIT
jgi:hypothetical protein